MTKCNGGGDNGSHCCYINGEVCPLLTVDIRCSVWGEWDSPAYQVSAMARHYETRWPGKGYTCADWPQNIPEVMDQGVGLCCWES